MNKNGKILLILLAVLAVIAGAYALITALLAEDAQEETAETLLSIDTSAITGIGYSHEGQEYRFLKEGDAWVYAYDKTYPIDPACMQNMLDNLAAASAQRVLHGADGAEYGLNDDAKWVALTAADGTETTLYFGLINESAAVTYLRLEEGGDIYVVDRALKDCFSYGLVDMTLADPLPTADEESVTYLSVKNGDESYDISYIEDPARISYSGSTNYFIRENGGMYSPLDPDMVQNLLWNLANLKEQEIAAIQATDAVRAQYGLADPIEIKVVYADTQADSSGTEQSYTLYLGDMLTREEGEQTHTYRYVTTDQSDMVYLVENSFFENVAVHSDMIYEVRLINFSFDSVDAMDITVDGATHRMDITREEVDGEEEVTCTFDGQPSYKTSTYGFMGYLAALDTEGNADHIDTAQLEPYMQVVLHRNTQYFQTITVTIYEYNANFYVGECSGRTDKMLLNVKDVQFVKEFFDLM